MINVHGALFFLFVCFFYCYGESLSYGKMSYGGGGDIRLLYFIHVMLEPVDTLLYQESLHMDTLLGTRRRDGWEREKRQLLVNL